MCIKLNDGEDDRLALCFFCGRDFFSRGLISAVGPTRFNILIHIAL